MYYLLTAIFLVLLGGITYLYYSKKSINEENILEDIPSIDVRNEDLERHALEISKDYSETKITNSRRKIIKSLDLSYKKILDGYEFIDRDVRNKKEVVSAGEWLLDNLYLIEKEYKHIKQSMPENYYNNLPVISKGVMKGYPRIYHIAVEMVAHTDGKIDETSILRFIEAYQSNTVLTSGELWALPIMLRIALIQNISKITDKIIKAQKEKARADAVADELINSIETGDLNEKIKNLSAKDIPFSSHFCERLLKVLRDNGVDNVEIYQWIDEELELKETNSERMINLEHQKQANSQLSMGNCVDSVRQVEGLNWRDGFEEVSYVEKILRKDPSNIYSKMDFESRDYYRHNVENLAKKINKPESFVAKKAIDCAESYEGDENNNYKKHVGYYLVDEGLEELNYKIKNNSKSKNNSFFRKNKKNMYLAIVILGTLMVMSFFLYISYINDTKRELWRYVIAVLALLIPCSEIVISILNWSINHLMVPDFIPKLELKEGIDEENKTIVVIPTIVNTEERVEELISNMEVYYLANSEKNLYFALLADFKDSENKEEKSDKQLIKTALEAVKNLNKKYGSSDKEIFYFLSRYRKYNDNEKIWMGWERKRGKLEEFNKLIRGAKDTSYDIISGNINSLIGSTYVITLDSDTQLPRDTAKKLVGAMSHILNVPHLENKRKKVIRGYGLMQPKISISTVSANKTLFSKIFSGETGIDTYTTAVSDVYQDVFKEGIFTGKGIYHVDTFIHMMSGEIPENSILSHDLLEGAYVRAALVTDLELVDGYPSNYNGSSKRLHRWVRGDWQLIPWLSNKDSINSVSKWKIIDNLRRSLVAPSIILLFALSYQVLPDGTDKWIVAAIVAIVIPLLFDVTEVIVSPMRGMNLSGKLDGWKSVIEQIFLIFCFIPHKAYLMTDAIVRTIYRLSISKKHMLEWQTAADADKEAKDEIGYYVREMYWASIIALVIGVLAFVHSTSSGFLMLPSCIIWFFSPYVAYIISKDIEKAHYNISDIEKTYIKKLARETWAYFEDFQNDENNWLAPDNYQVEPHNGVAHRTSPTNMAMGIISNIAAYDLGYIGIMQCVDRIDKTVVNMETLKRYKGHFYNWYDTKTKEILRPEYISTVDSGNLVGYLWVTSTSLEEYLNKPIINNNFGEGLKVVLSLANKEIEERLNQKNYYGQILQEIDNIDVDILNYKRILLDLWDKCIKVSKNSVEQLYWNEKVKDTLSLFLVEMQRIFPWADLLIERTNKLEEVSEKLKEVFLTVKLVDLSAELDSIIKDVNKISFKDKDQKYLSKELLQLMKNSKNEINNFVLNIQNVKKRINNIATATDFKVLYDEKRQLFSIGYDVEKDSIGRSYYDLLASEARQASFVAIAKGDVDQKHWFKLGRSMAIMGRSKGLVSWSGTMFEYFMPLLIMKPYPRTLLYETYKSVLEGQKRYCKTRRVPWGISESAFRSFDVGLNYQYKAFGIPGIGLKRGLMNELVISPYSTVMALQIDKKGALNNIQKIIAEGGAGRYGLYEAIDYTKDRMPKGKKKAVVKCFMVHHQGMSLLALDNTINNNILQNRFHSVPMVKATELLLQEKVPKRIVYEREQKFEVNDSIAEKQNVIVRRYEEAVSDTPETQLLSNGSYALMITNSGSGYSKLNDMTVYRWHEDVTLDNTGMFFYVKDVSSSDFYSVTYEPCKIMADKYNVVFSLDKAEFTRVDGDVTTKTEIAVSNEDNAEVRKISITNHGNKDKIIEVTSYCEVTLAPANSDLVHPAFSNLFIRTEYNNDHNCIIANRRPRENKSRKPWVMQNVVVEGNSIGQIQYETSRANFIGRGGDLKNPSAMEGDTPLRNTVGAVLDPIISIRKRVKIAPGECCKVSFSLAVAESRKGILELSRKYKEQASIDRVFELAWTQSQVEMSYLGIKYPQANLYQSMASKILFINKAFQDKSDLIKNVKRNQPSLWQYGISGDVPIVTVIVNEEKDKDLVRQMLNAHEFWSIKGLKVDLVLLNLQNVAYFQPLQDSLRDLISTSHARDKVNKSGGVFLKNKSSMDNEDVNLILAISRLIVDGQNSFALSKTKELEETNKAKLEITKAVCYSGEFKFPTNKLKFFNEFGGFDLEKDQYVIKLKNDINTPAPWINVVANKDFGFHVSESGNSYTWCGNSRENKITAWSNDWIKDTPTEAMFIRDEEMGVYWSLSPKPVRDEREYIIEHGFGYSNFKHEAYGIIGEMKMFVPLNHKLKICLVNLKNNTSEKRKLSLSYYAHIVLGVVPQHTSTHVATYLNKDKKYIYAQNPYNTNFGKILSYLSIVGGENESFTGDRTEFIGRNKSIENPEFMEYTNLSDKVGGGLDPCVAENTKFSLEANEEKNILILFGAEESVEDIEKTINEFSNLDRVYKEIDNVKENWDELLKTIEVKTPDDTMDIMLNGWFLYQTIACRLWSRTAFYQSGGAYGFRDQLQDVMSLSYIKPEVTRKQIIYAATRQYTDGDVQHWWHPIVESGIRTRFSDDLLWLPYVTIDYINNTGDYSVLDEIAGYMEDEPLKEDEDERYTISKVSDQTGTVYEHCIKAIERALKFGEHNIPLMGCGDWNDGMNTIGNKGKGESVWVGWFLYDILNDFKNISKFKEDEYRAGRYEEMQEFIKENLEKYAWDGSWYRRAYFDDGTPLGSIENEECQIDSLSQSWSVISGAARQERAKEAMHALEKYLVKYDKGMVLLLTPAFDKTKLEPGYIKGYVPGVRENGGQYTHAATWVVLALTKLGDGDKACKIFNMINPINHTKSYYECERYKVEPYVMAADVYEREPHTGRGGWTWYTGAAGWMYRVGIDGILGLKLKGDKGFSLEPVVPKEWNGFQIKYKHNKATYIIDAKKGEKSKITMDGKLIQDSIIPYVDKGEHHIEVIYETSKIRNEMVCQ